MTHAPLDAEAEFAIHGDFIEFSLPDNPGEECGVIGTYLTEDGERMLREDGGDLRHMMYKGLKRQVHRGRQNTGMGISVDGQRMEVVTGVGSPEEAFLNGEILGDLPPHGRFGLAHNRYATVGGILGGQPTELSTASGELYLVVNGQLPNYRDLGAKLPPHRRIQPTDSWIHTAAIADKIDEGSTAPGAMVLVSEMSEGAYSMVAFHNGELVAMRDPRGMRPLVIGRIGQYGYAFASEHSTLRAMGVKLEREVRPGEIITINDTEGFNTIDYATPDPKMCVFEEIYLGDPSKRRVQSGRILAREAPAPSADMVVPVPRSAYATARGYAEESGLPYVTAIRKIRRHRTFMADGEGSKTIYRLKRSLVEDRSVVVLDDSIVRKKTAAVIAELFQLVGAEVHFRVGSPPIKWPCFYGVATPTREELIANHMTPDQLRDDLGFASLQYLSEKGLIKAFGKKVCNACITGNYPTSVNDQANGRPLLPVVGVTAHI